MEVKLSSSGDLGNPASKESEARFDLTRLRPEERALWDRYCAGDWEDAPVLAAWSFGHICMLDAWGPPQVVIEHLDELDPDNKIQQYQDNVRRARNEGQL